LVWHERHGCGAAANAGLKFAGMPSDIAGDGGLLRSIR